MKNPDHTDPDWELAVLIGGMVVGWCILGGSLIAYFLWYIHR